MKINKIFLVSMFVLAIITLGAVSAAEEAGNLTVSDNAGEAIEAPVDEIEVAADISGGDELADDNEVPMNISIPDDVKYGGEFYVGVTVPEDATGYVKLAVDDDSERYAEYDYEGQYSFDVGLYEFGQHTFTAIYTPGEDDHYADTVKEVKYFLNNTQYSIGVPNVQFYGIDGVRISAPVLSPSNIEITVNGKKYNVYEYGGEWEFDSSILKYGENTVNVYYPGDKVFAEYSSVENIEVYSVINSEDNIYFDETLNVTIILPDDATGKLTVYDYEMEYDDETGETNYTYTELASASVKDGFAKVCLSDLTTGENNLMANFTGNYNVGNYEFSAYVYPRIKVPKAILAGEDAYVIVEGSKDTEGGIYVSETFEEENNIDIGTSPFENGIAKVSLADLDAGTHEILVSWEANNQGGDVEYTLYVVENYDFNVTITRYYNPVIVDSFDNAVEFDAPEYADGDVFLKIDGRVVDRCPVDQGCDLYFDATNLTIGEHTLTLDFVSETQKNSSDSVKLDVIVASIDIPDKIIANYLDENVNPTRIFVGVCDDSTGNITVLVDNEVIQNIPFGNDNKISFYFALDDVSRGTHNVTVTVNDKKYGSVSKSNMVEFDYILKFNVDEWTYLYYGESNTIMLYPPNYLGNGDLIVTIDGKEMDWAYGQYYNEIFVNASGLAMGNHTIAAKYTGDELYPAREVNATFEVGGYIDCPYSSFVLGSDEKISLMLPSDAKGSLNLTINMVIEDDEYNTEYVLVAQKIIPLENGIATYSLTDLEVGYYEMTANYIGNDYHVQDKWSDLAVIEDDGMDYGEDTIVLGENKTITFTSREDNQSTLSLTLYKIDRFAYEWEDTAIEIETKEITITNGKVAYTFSNLTLGDYHIRAVQEYDDHPGYQGGHDFRVLPTDVVLPRDIHYIGEKLNVSIELPGDADGKVVLTIDPDEIGTSYDVSGPINFELPVLPCGYVAYRVNYTGNYGNFISGWEYLVIEDDNRFNPDIDVNVSEVEGSDNIIIDVTAPVLSVGNITVAIGDKTYDAELVKGKATLTAPGLKGKYNVTVTFNEDSKYLGKTMVVPVNGSKIQPTIEATADERIVEGSTLTVNVTVANATGKVAVNGKDADLINGKASIDVNDLALGNNTLFVFYGGDEIYENASTTIMVNVYPKQDAQLAADVLDINVGETAVVNVQINPNATGKLTVNGTEVVPQNGKVSVPFADLAAGEYPIAINFEGDKYVKPANVTISFKVNKVQPKPGDDPFKPAENETKSDNLTYTISMPSDATGNLTVTIGNKTYTKELVNGTATIEITDLPAGTYEAVVTYTGDDKYEAVTKTENATVKVTPKITAKNTTTVLYTAKGKFTVTVYGDDGKVASGVDVVFIIKGKQIKKTTNSNGIAKYTVTRVPGTYKVTVKALGVNTTKTLKVKHVVTLKKATVKRSAKKLTLTATLSKVNGKYLKKKTVTFKFKGKKYTAKTNAKGVAKVTIKSAVLKKLKAGKKVTYSATYKKDTVKKTVKVKK